VGTQPDFRSDRIRVIPLDPPDHLSISHDVRSRYVERFWLGVLGPATTLFLRWAATELDRAPGGFWMDVEQTARQLGLVSSSRHRPFHRCLSRACTFGHAESVDPSMLGVRSRLPELTPNQLAKLPDQPGMPQIPTVHPIVHSTSYSFTVFTCTHAHTHTYSPIARKHDRLAPGAQGHHNPDSAVTADAMMVKEA
jgi:hypothetical protein